MTSVLKVNIRVLRITDFHWVYLLRCTTKVLIFSQMTQMMDILEDYCCLRQHSYCRLDGSMKMVDRHDEVNSSCAFLVSVTLPQNF